MNVIKSSLEISRIFSKGKKINTASVTLLVLNQSDRASNSSGRIAFIAGKKSGNAVWRNSAKRRLREISKQINLNSINYDIILIARRNILERDFWTIVKECEKVKLKLSK